MQLLTPAPVSNVYSDVDMRLRLAVVPTVDTLCLGVECVLNRDFDQRVQKLGDRLSTAAFDGYPELVKRVSHFEFVVAEKEEFGSASNAAGTIVVFRGVQKLYLDDEGLAFLLAREMGHVIGRHHDENSVPTIAFTVLTTVLFPVAGIFKGASFLAGTTSATATVTTTSAVTAAASSATSYIGSHAILASLRPDQLSEADVIALKLLTDIGCDKYKVANDLDGCTQAEGDDAWVEDFHISVGHVKKLTEQSDMRMSTLVASRTDLQGAQDVVATVDETAVTEIVANAEPDAIIEPGSSEPVEQAGQPAIQGIGSVSAANMPSAEAEKTVDGVHQEYVHADDALVVTANAVVSGVAPDAPAQERETARLESPDTLPESMGQMHSMGEPILAKTAQMSSAMRHPPVKKDAQNRKLVKLSSVNGRSVKDKKAVSHPVSRRTAPDRTLLAAKHESIAKPRMIKERASSVARIAHNKPAAHKANNGSKSGTVGSRKVLAKQVKTQGRT